MVAKPPTMRTLGPSRGGNSVKELNLERLEVVGQGEAEDLGIERRLRLERAADVGRLAEAVAFALERQVGVRNAPLPQGSDDLFGLRLWHDMVVAALEDEQRFAETVDVVDRRALVVQREGLRIRPDQLVHVARLEFVRLARERLDVAHAEVGSAGGEDVVERQRAQGGVAAGAAATNRHARWIDITTLRQVARGIDAVVDVIDAPRAVELAHVLATVAVGAAVVDVDHGEAAAGEELLAQIQERRRERRRAAVVVE